MLDRKPARLLYSSVQSSSPGGGSRSALAARLRSLLLSREAELAAQAASKQREVQVREAVLASL